MLKTILNLKGVEALSLNEMKSVIGSGEPIQAVCMIPYTSLPYHGPCIMGPAAIPDPIPAYPTPFPYPDLG
ncbi:hypothetical protein B0A75_17025 [Flavobacterium oncorhynchi]|uniref:Uncharacterized protein n=2 Tax=Flavobacterium oncorhynchi TaxID=728056 RepID=A0A226HU00_9FLAO|nr:hypothetical protein B0A75_17025 [Flavobacterium oncorhynchi]